MINSEPVIHVGIIERRREIRGRCLGDCTINGGESIRGEFAAVRLGKEILLTTPLGIGLRAKEIRIVPNGTEAIAVVDVTIGLQFHWERKEEELFRGIIRLVPDKDGISVVNEIGLEEYLKSVICSEMSPTSPPELLKAHAVTSRSWLVAMLEQQKQQRNLKGGRKSSRRSREELIRWYDREDHPLFNVCADDHCQRYQGITKIISTEASNAVESTRGLFLMYGTEICDARFSKACGGITERFESAWNDRLIPYLQSVSDAAEQHLPASSELDAKLWIMSRPSAYCNTTDIETLKKILPSFDQETVNFFRWKVVYKQDELSALILRKSGLNFGLIRDLVPVQRGPSGRIVRLRIVGTEKTLVVGKELEIRKWLSPSHLYSSAFVVTKSPAGAEIPDSFTLDGAGWGHGVGLCQIGAAVMATKGKGMEEILLHYFKNAKMKRLY